MTSKTANPWKERAARRRALPSIPKSVTGAIQAAAEAPSWYQANFSSAAGQDTQEERRRNRQGLASLLREVSSLKRVRECGRPLGNSYVVVKKTTDGAAYSAGVTTCGSVWACPSCSAKIRAGRADEVTRGVQQHAKLFPGATAAFVTLTMPHRKHHTLRQLLDIKAKALKRVFSGRAWQDERQRYQILGQITSEEITRGDNGWHPHRHGIVLFGRKLSADEHVVLSQQWQARWDRALISLGWPASAVGIGVKLQNVVSTHHALALYLTKLQEGGANVIIHQPKLVDGDRTDHAAAAELSRGDLKNPAKGSRTPFEILADFGNDGVADDLDLWTEYEAATKGRSAIRWSRGLRTLLEMDEVELTDEELAAAEVDGEAVAALHASLYRKIMAMPNGVWILWKCAELEGISGIRRFVAAMGLDVNKVLEPLPGMSARMGE